MLRITIGLILLWLLLGCSSRYDYTIHKPTVKYAKPSYSALQAMLKESDGKPYVWAEEGEDAFDCSGLVYYCYGSMNVWLPRVSWQQAKAGVRVSIDELQYGDLIFFGKYNSKSQVNHVGIYIGNGYFRHASSAKEGVITSRVDKPYYRNRIVVCRRIISTKKSFNARQEKLKKQKIYKTFKRTNKITKRKDITGMDATISLF
jgi:hypothetical protein